MYVKTTDYNMCNDAIQWQILTFVKAIMHICVQALTVSEILTLQMFSFENLGQCHEVQRSQLSHSMAYT